MKLGFTVDKIKKYSLKCHSESSLEVVKFDLLAVVVKRSSGEESSVFVAAK